MKKIAICSLLLVLALAACARRTPKSARTEKTAVTVDWNKVIRVSNTNATLQAVVSPLMSRNSPIHDKVFRALEDLRCDYVRYVPWLPYPKLAVAELEPPANGKTSWDFSLIDPFAADFAQATQGHSTIWNYSTIPQWMFKTEKPVPYPADPNQVIWDYERGTDLRDLSMKELADYYARLVSWYTKGGFTDEYGQRHESGHHYKIDYWEVLNEIDFEHYMSPETYTRIYDAIVSSIRRVDPQMKFVALALAGTSPNTPLLEDVPRYFEYFLNPKNRKPASPVDMISFHFYASPTPDQSPEIQQYTFFDQVDHFLDVVRYIESIRQRLSPKTTTAADEIGVISADDASQGEPGHITKPIPDSYWNLCAAEYAYTYAGLARLGVDVVGESALAQLPSFFPSVTMVDWNTGQPNARYWVLKLLRESFGPGDRITTATVDVPYVYAGGFITPKGEHKVLLVNKRDRPFEVSLPDGAGAIVQYVDRTTGSQPPASIRLAGDTLTLRGLAVAVVTFSNH
jgi:hypothetical protein